MIDKNIMLPKRYMLEEYARMASVTREEVELLKNIIRSLLGFEFLLILGAAFSSSPIASIGLMVGAIFTAAAAVVLVAASLVMTHLNKEKEL